MLPVLLAGNAPSQLLLILPTMPHHQFGMGTGSPYPRYRLQCCPVCCSGAPSKQMPNLIMGSSSRPAGVFLPTWSHGCPAALDVQVISPLQQHSLGEAVSTPGLPLHEVFDRSCPHTTQPAHVFRLWWRLQAQEIGRRYHTLERLFPEELAIKTFQMTLQSAPSSFFTKLPYGEGMPPLGSITNQPFSIDDFV